MLNILKHDLFSIRFRTFSKPSALGHNGSGSLYDGSFEHVRATCLIKNNVRNPDQIQPEYICSINFGPKSVNRGSVGSAQNLVTRPRVSAGKTRSQRGKPFWANLRPNAQQTWRSWQMWHNILWQTRLVQRESDEICVQRQCLQHVWYDDTFPKKCSQRALLNPLTVRNLTL